ncbi:hypothetical protein [Enterobacter sp. 214E4]|uniref:hypothetical protein n=1 Tax=Enterobacter sp. 214E4 TaxID=3077759 RepID=UPI002A83FC34|nr:hypothetical protein [Enterobacter sp. 214E4]
MDKFANWFYTFINKAIWICALILIFVLTVKPVTLIANNPDAFSSGSLNCMYYLVWIITSVIGVYYVAKILSNIIAVSEPFFYVADESDEEKVKPQHLVDKTHR